MTRDKKRTPETRTIFNNYYDSDRWDEVQQFLFENYADENDWEDANDVPDDEVWDQLYFEYDLDWEDARHDLEKFMRDNGPLLVVGSLGLWYGNCAGGKICKDLRELSGAWEDCDYINIYDQNGHLYIKCSHHDGSNYFECKVLTEKGENYADDHSWDMDDQDLHKRLWNDSHYTHLPHFAHQVYGCRKTAYVKAE
ncbi:MAG: hypothetical protein J6S14_11950 [Clostridia bacterium]|nr:hypothetical protein [Clostridia bacterium]